PQGRGDAPRERGRSARSAEVANSRARIALAKQESDGHARYQDGGAHGARDAVGGVERLLVCEERRNAAPRSGARALRGFDAVPRRQELPSGPVELQTTGVRRVDQSTSAPT